MKKFFLAILFILIIYLVINLVYIFICWWQEDRLSDKADQITEGISEDEMINIMGTPKYKGVVSTDKIDKGFWMLGNYEMIKRDYDTLVVYGYYIKTYSLKTFREIPPSRIIRIYLDPVTRKVVYASCIFILADW